MKDTEKALRWYCSRIGKRIPELDIHEKHCVSIMYEYAKYYHEQQVKSVDLDSVVGRSEQLVCDCGDSDMTWYGNENDKKWFCFRCKKEAN